MPSVNNYNTRLQVTSDISLCRTIKGQEYMSSSNIKTAVAAASFKQRLKKDVVSKRQE